MLECLWRCGQLILTNLTNYELCELSFQGHVIANNLPGLLVSQSEISGRVSFIYPPRGYLHLEASM
jgi:hypothetical protein